MDLELGEDRLKKIVQTTHDLWLDEEYADNNFEKMLWVPIEQAMEEIRTARRETAQLDEDCVMWWKEKYMRLAKLFTDTFSVQWEEESPCADSCSESGEKQ